jgi:hypothetical protein
MISLLLLHPSAWFYSPRLFWWFKTGVLPPPTHPTPMPDTILRLTLKIPLRHSEEMDVRRRKTQTPKKTKHKKRNVRDHSSSSKTYM